MQSFTYLCPTEVVFGKDTENQTAALVRKYGGSRILLVYGGGSVVRSGLLDRVTANLADSGLSYATFGGAKANPTMEHAREGVQAALDFEADFILAIGGGSSIDTAKAIAMGTASPEIDLEDFWSGRQNPVRSIPVGAILTISAAGSETSDSAVLTNMETGVKRGLSSDFNRPKFAVLNPELTYTLPTYQIACGVVDIMMHTLDRYFNPLDNELTDSIAEALLRTVIAKGPAAIADSHDYDAMSELMWAGSLSHNGLTGLGGNKDFTVHQLGHQLSATFDTAHGASLSTVWEAWAHAVYQAKPSRFARYARNVWGLTGDDEDALALAGIQATGDYFRSLNMPTSFGSNSDIGIQDEESLRKLAACCSYHQKRTIGTFRVLDAEAIYQIYKEANH